MVGPAAEAYIIMRADGTLVPGDVKKYAKEAGEDFAEEFSDEFEETLEKRQEKTLKDFNRRLADSFETLDFSGLRNEGEGVNDLFVRLGSTLEELHKNNYLRTDSFEQFFKAFDTYDISEQIKEIEAVDATYTKEWEKNRAKQDASMVSLGRKMEDIAIKERAWIDNAAEIAAVTGEWDKFVKKMGGADEAMRRLGARTDEVRKASAGYSAEMDYLDESLIDYIESTQRAARAALEQAEETRELAESTKAHEEATKKASRAEDQRVKSLGRMQTEMEKVSDASREMLDAMLVKSSFSGEWDKTVEHIRRTRVEMDLTGDEAAAMAAITDVVTERLSYLNGEGAITQETFSKVAGSFYDYRDGLARAHDEMNSGSARRRAFIDDLGKIGDRAGRSFGKGARNDFVNFFGSLVGGITKFALQTPARLFNVAADAVDAFSDQFSKLTSPVAEGGKGLSSMAAILPSLAKGFTSMAPSAGAAALSVVAVSQAVGALASAVSLTGGMLVILGQALYLSVAAPLLALIPAVVSFGAGAVVAGVAISKWAENSKPLKRALGDISNELEKVAVKITPAMDGLAKFFGEAGQSMVQKFGDSAKNVLDDLYLKLNSPDMDKFYSTWALFMPDIFETLGKSISSFAVGLTAFFVPILPFAERLAASIKRGADTFALWAQSTEGQNSIRDWMTKAWEVATDLWSGLRDIGSALGNIFGMSTGQGANFATWIKDIGDRFEKWTESKQGREDIKRWLEDAAEFAKDLKDVVSLLADAFDALDSPGGRDALGAFVDLFKIMAGGAVMAALGLAAVNSAVSSFNQSLVGAWNGIWAWFENLSWAGIWEGIVSGLGAGLSAVGTWLWEQTKRAGQTIVDGFKAVLGINSPSTVMMEMMADVGLGILNGLMAIPAMLYGAIASVASSIVTGLSNGLSSLSTKVGEKFDSVKTAVTTKAAEIGQTVSTVFGGLPQRAADALSTLGTRIGSRFDTAKTTATTKATSLVTGARSALALMPTRASEALSNLSSKIGSRFDTARTSATGKANDLVSRARTALSRMPAQASSALSNLSSRIGSRFDSARTTASGKASNLVSTARTRLAQLPSQASSAISGLAGRVGAQFDRARNSAMTKARGIVTAATGALRGMAGAVGGALSGVASAISRPFEQAVGFVERALGRIRQAAATATSVASSIKMPSLPGVPWFASGGVISGARVVGVGEAGPEAIVPLNRPLASVDPSVRWLSAVAQGMAPSGGGGGGISIAPGAIQVVTPYSDPALVANQVLDDIVANF